ncbi:MAG: hypothetical protein JWO78_138 [Micavibrio sp.]|nr:hypothetical protein [Micavibrio sp.]
MSSKIAKIRIPDDTLENIHRLGHRTGLDTTTLEGLSALFSKALNFYDWGVSEEEAGRVVGSSENPAALTVVAPALRKPKEADGPA